LILGSLDSSEFLEILTLLPLFNGRYNSWVDKSHPYELDEKNCTKKALNKENMNGKKCIEQRHTY
jgi:hypothetical protein